MLIIKMIGGIGNQLFQLSFYMYLQNNGFDCELDILSQQTYKLHDKQIILDYIDCNYFQISNESDIKMLGDLSNNIFSRLRRYFGNVKKSHLFESNFSEKSILKEKDYYLDGYWQDLKFILPIESKIRKHFKFRPSKSKINKKLIDLINSCKNSTSIHIRGGDFLNNEIYSNICTVEYYERSIQYLDSTLKKVNYFVFTDDILYAKKLLKDFDGIFIESDSVTEPWIDIFLMSLCKNNIISNSTFSWWGAYLNENVNKLVLHPPKMTNTDKKDTKIFPEGWIKI